MGENEPKPVAYALPHELQRMRDMAAGGLPYNLPLYPKPVDGALPLYLGPIDMVLYCPACGVQHIDRQDPPTPTSVLEAILRANPLAIPAPARWTNPPHKSHLCHECGHIWRPADVPTNGVAETKTRGLIDSPIVTKP